MSHSIRFLGLAILAWAGVRAVSLGMVPGMKALAFDLPSRSTAAPASRLPAVQPTELPPIEPVSPAVTYPPNGGVSAMAYQPYGAYLPYAAYGPYPVYVPVPAASPRNSSPQIIYVNPPVMQPPEINVYGGGPDMESAPQKLAMAEPIPQMQSSPQWKSTPSIAEASQPGRLDRLSLSSWAMLRDQPGSQSLASGGTLGGSQAGVRLLWKFNPHIAASLRTNAPINGQRSAEVALGARFQPFVSWPIAFTVERRQSVGRYGGQDAFAVFAEGGAYGRPMPWNSTLDAYLQTGIVGAKRRDWFVDGSAALTRPVWRNVSAGFGVWGGAQPGLNRLDMGPRASMRVTNKVRVHLDYRQKLLGNAAPGSGGVVTLAGDF